MLPCRNADTDDIDVPDCRLRGASPQYDASLSWLGKSAMSMDVTSSDAVFGPIPGTVSRHPYVSSDTSSSDTSAVSAPISAEFSVILPASSRTARSSQARRLMRSFRRFRRAEKRGHLGAPAAGVAVVRLPVGGDRVPLPAAPSGYVAEVTLYARFFVYVQPSVLLFSTVRAPSAVTPVLRTKRSPRRSLVKLVKARWPNR